MIYKEENILFPMAMETLSDADWQKVEQGENEIGYAWIVPEQGGSAEETVSPALKKSAEGSVSLDLATGQLTPERVNLMLTHLPVGSPLLMRTMKCVTTRRLSTRYFPAVPA